jgi:hypothetical protein
VSDRLYLSCWLEKFSALNMHQAYLRVSAVDETEPALHEQVFNLVSEKGALVDVMRGWNATDSCFEVEGYWDLWQLYEEGWKLKPSRVHLFFYGPAFPSDLGEQIRMELGLETQYLPALDESSEGLRLLQSNIRSLLQLSRDLEGRLKVKERRLWSESGANFAQRLQQSLLEASRQ